MLVPMSIKTFEFNLGLALWFSPRNVLPVGETPLVAERRGGKGVSLVQVALSDHAGTGGDAHLKKRPLHLQGSCANV